MKCTECGTTMKTQRENYRYDESGLKKVTLVGIEVSRCPRCGNYEVSIPHMEDLHRLIARAVIEKTTRLTSEEVRFLRKSLGWSGVDFARNMGVTEETVSRWENGAVPIGPQADRLLEGEHGRVELLALQVVLPGAEETLELLEPGGVCGGGRPTRP